MRPFRLLLPAQALCQDAVQTGGSHHLSAFHPSHVPGAFYTWGSAPGPVLTELLVS